MSQIPPSLAPALPAHMTLSKAKTLIATGSPLLRTKRKTEESRTTSSHRSSIQKESSPCSFGFEASQPSLLLTTTYPLRMVDTYSIAKLLTVLCGECSWKRCGQRSMATTNTSTMDGKRNLTTYLQERLQLSLHSRASVIALQQFGLPFQVL
jgi:hypothetical protein